MGNNFKNFFKLLRPSNFSECKYFEMATKATTTITTNANHCLRSASAAVCQFVSLSICPFVRPSVYAFVFVYIAALQLQTRYTHATASMRYFYIADCRRCCCRYLLKHNSQLAATEESVKLVWSCEAETQTEGQVRGQKISVQICLFMFFFFF